MNAFIKRIKPDKSTEGIKFRAGLFLIVISYPISFIAVPAGVMISRLTYPWLGLSIGIAVYAFSWVVFFMGIWLAGKKGIRLLKYLWRKIRKKMFAN